MLRLYGNFFCFTGNSSEKFAADLSALSFSGILIGKYIVIVAGDTGDVKSSMKEGLERAGEYLVDSLLIPNIHEQLIPAISGANAIDHPEAVGVLEFYSIASAILAADTAAKAANIRLIEVRIGYAIGGKGFVTLTGDVGAVRSAVAAGIAGRELYVDSVVIPRPDPKVIESLL